METNKLSTVFFDIGETLGSVRLSASADRIERIDVFPQVPGILRALGTRGARLGIISNRGSIGEDQVKQALDEGGLLSFFDPALIIFGRKDSTAIFREAARLADRADAPQSCLFVGENPNERDFAALAGLRTVASPRDAIEVLSSPSGNV